MATIGLRKPYIAKYGHTEGAVDYTLGRLLAKAIEFTASIESSEENNLDADDGIAESDRSFSNGTLTITTDDLEQEASAMILGITPKTITVGTETDVSELVYDDDMETPDLGFGVIIPKKVKGVNKFRAVVFHKVKFSIPEDSAVTQGETIEWQTPSLTGTIMRDDTEKRGWKSEATLSTSELAETYIKEKLGIGA